MSQQISFQKLDEKAVLPLRGSANAAALDLSSVEELVIPAHGFAKVRTGLAVAIPEGYYGRIAGRSGWAAKNGIDTLGGVVDSDYRGEILCVLANHSAEDFKINIGERIAQFIIEAIITPEPVFVECLPATEGG
jgi:dUTP pyrophosphatase